MRRAWVECMCFFGLPAPSVSAWIISSAALVACIDDPLHESPPSTRIVISWDPLACGAPHRVAIELEDEAGVSLSASPPCALGGLVLDAPHPGVYFGRVYAWEVDRGIRSVTPVRLYVDEPIARWIVATPA